MTKNILTFISIAGLALLPACSKAQTPTESAPTQTQVQKNEFKVSHVNARQASEMMTARPDLVVLDVRTPREYAAGHIDGALNIDFNNANFSTQLADLDTSKDYLIHCRSGGRSTSSLRTFERLGFSHIIHMDGGMNGWSKASLPTVE